MPPGGTITAVELWDQARAVRVMEDLRDENLFLAFELRDTLIATGRSERASAMTLHQLSPAVVAEPPILTDRRVVRIVFQSGEWEEFRISKAARKVDASGPAAVTLEPLWQDLGSRASAQRIGSRVDYQWSAIGRDASEVLALIMGSGAPSHFVAGNVEAARDVEIFFQADGQTHLDLLRLLCTEISAATGLRCEWDVRRVGNNYAVDIVDAIGGSITHPIDGDIAGGRWNRDTLTRTMDATAYFSRVVPLSGSDGDQGTIAGASWPIASRVIEGNGNTAVVLEGAPIYVSGAPSAAEGDVYLVEGGTYGRVVNTLRPGTVIVAGGVAFMVGNHASFRLLPSGAVAPDGFVDLTFLADPAAETAAGIKDRIVRRADIGAYRNLLELAGVSADLSNWPSLPRGVNRSAASVSVQRSTERAYVQAGTAAMVVRADAGQYIETEDLEIPETGYISAWVALRVLSGGVRLSIADPEGTLYPVGAEAVAGIDTEVRGLAIGGLQLPALDEDEDGGYRLRIAATEDGTRFVVDSWTVTNSPSAVEYAPDMGPVALWNAASGELAVSGGLTPDRLEGQWIDLSQLDASVDAAKIGATVRLRDAGGDMDATTRIVSLKRMLAGAEGTEKVSGVLGSRRADLEGLLSATGRRGPRSTLGVRDEPGLEIDVAVDDRRARPVFGIVYPAGVEELRIEVPLRPADLAADGVYPSTARRGAYGLPPVVAEKLPNDGTVGYRIIDDLEDTGGEATHTVGADALTAPPGTLEDDLEPGAVRGEYRVYALRAGQWYFGWSGNVHGAPVAAPGVEYDSVTNLMVDDPDAPENGNGNGGRTGNGNGGPGNGGTPVDEEETPQLTLTRIRGIRTTGTGEMLALVWRLDEDAWAEVAVGGSEIPDEGVPHFVLEGEGWAATVRVVSGTVQHFTLAARTGADTVESPYVYHDVTDFPVGFADPEELGIQTIRVTEEPKDAGGRPEGTLFCQPVVAR